jgi:hypothetical protein
LVNAGLGAASVLANLHHRRIIPLMEMELRIYEMGETANPVSLARSRLVHDRSPQEYASTWARCAIASRLSGIATTTSGGSLCSPSPHR